MNLEFNDLDVPSALGLSIVAVISTMPAISFAQVQKSSLSIAESTKQLNYLIELALMGDTMRSQYAAQSQAIRESGVASATLMDPKLKVGFGGLPVDSFKFNEDPMTNISVGIMQQFERGATLDLNQRKANQQADSVAYQVQVRERVVANNITQLWLELGYLQFAESIIIENHRLMLEMEQYVQTNYSIGKSEAQDLLNIQLQANKLDEKLQSNRQMQNRVVAQLSEWLGSEWINSRSVDSNQAVYQLDWSRLDTLLEQQINNTQYYALLNQHPMAQIADANISVNRTQVEVAEQSYTPQFSVEVMYAYRQSDNMMGEPASDLLSAYLTMDIPLFTDNRQDKNVAAAQYQVGAAQYQKDTLIAQMNAQVNALMTDRMNFTERIERYQERLLPQSKVRIEAVERGYQNNTTQLADVISASNDELALQVELARLITDLNQTNSKLASLLGGFEYQITAPNAQYQNRVKQ
ncbi:MAG: TolC family protein [Pseudomonadota bacterium]|nr:TolC family protein [Pseudomonadota bacterium]